MNKIFLCMMSSAAIFTGCNNTGFTAAPNALLSQSNPPSTTTGPGGSSSLPCQVGTVTKDIRIMFMMDNSGSTATTDRDHTFRVQTVEQFIHDFGGKTNLTYNFGYFGDTSAWMFDAVTNQFPVSSAANPVGNSNQLSTALNIYKNLPLNGATPYYAGFSALKNAIIADERAGHKQDYAVVFMSDGQPTDVASPIVQNLLGLVDTLKAAASPNGSNLTLTTVYFGDDSDSTSIGNLKSMATRGGGQFVDTNNLASGGLILNDVITVPGTCQ